jgi:hypothetical protein
MELSAVDLWLNSFYWKSYHEISKQHDELSKLQFGLVGTHQYCVGKFSYIHSKNRTPLHESLIEKFTQIATKEANLVNERHIVRSTLTAILALHSYEAIQKILPLGIGSKFRVGHRYITDEEIHTFCTLHSRGIQLMVEREIMNSI